MSELASCLINAQPLPAHHPATDDNSFTNWLHKTTTGEMIGR